MITIISLARGKTGRQRSREETATRHVCPKQTNSVVKHREVRWSRLPTLSKPTFVPSAEIPRALQTVEGAYMRLHVPDCNWTSGFRSGRNIASTAVGREAEVLLGLNTSLQRSGWDVTSLFAQGRRAFDMNTLLIRRGLLLVAVLVCAVLAAPQATAGKEPLTLGKTQLKVAPSSKLARQFRSAVRQELSRVALNAKPKDPYVVSATLVELTVSKSGHTAETVAVVSASLHNEKTGTLRALLRGKARAKDARTASSRATHAALRAAVRSALKRVPEALDKR